MNDVATRFPAATETKLVMDDLDALVDELHDARIKWYYVGLKLKVPVSKLKAIKGEHDDLADRLLEMLMEALERVEPLLTWRAVVEALRSPTVGLQQLAKKIEAKYCPPALPTETDKGTCMYYTCTCTCECQCN